MIERPEGFGNMFPSLMCYITSRHLSKVTSISIIEIGRKVEFKAMVSKIKCTSRKLRKFVPSVKFSIPARHLSTVTIVKITESGREVKFKTGQ